jgi:hypothetical protein
VRHDNREDHCEVIASDNFDGRRVIDGHRLDRTTRSGSESRTKWSSFQTQPVISSRAHPVAGHFGSTRAARDAGVNSGLFVERSQDRVLGDGVSI